MTARDDRDPRDEIGARLECDALVVGSGAGGAPTAALLAEAGADTLILEEGPRADTFSAPTHSPEAFLALYREGGMTPILGRAGVAYVEGRCVGGSTEINSAFWRRTPEDCLPRWREGWGLDAPSPAEMAANFARLEAALGVSRSEREASGPSARFREGVERLGWSAVEAPRCQRPETMAGSAFAPAAKQSMSRTFVPRALAAGARLVAGARVERIVVAGSGESRRATGAIATICGRRVEIRARDVFVCGGAVQTPALLLRSGIRANIGRSLRIHPMLKVAALFDEPMDAHVAPLPVFQVDEFPEITLGGSVFSPGFLALTLAENWEANRAAMADWRRMALYYVAVRGTNVGTVRPLPGGGTLTRYPLSDADLRHLSVGFARLAELLFAAGARAVHPGLRGFPVLRSFDECRRFLSEDLPRRALALSTVHAFGTCPSGENPARCAVDSFGRVRDFENLRVCDASVVPDSPGVNPQGTTMMFATRNAERYLELRGGRIGSTRAGGGR